VSRRLWVPKCLQLFIGNRKFGKAAIETHPNFGKHPNNWFIETFEGYAFASMDELME
jgi:hypothetical protein